MADKVKNKAKGTVKTVKQEVEINQSKKGKSPVIHDLEKKQVWKTGMEKGKDGTSYQLSLILDLSNLSKEEILVAAAEHLHIRWVRKQLLNVNSHLDQFEGQVIDVSNYRPVRARKADPVKSLKKQVQKLKDQGYSNEQIMDMLDENEDEE